MALSERRTVSASETGGKAEAGKAAAALFSALQAAVSAGDDEPDDGISGLGSHEPGQYDKV